MIAGILKGALSVLTFGITIPLGVIIAVFLWFHFDKSSDIRKAVDGAVKELVAGAELEAANARVEALNKIALERQQRVERLELANRNYANKLADANTQLDNANERIEKILSRPNRAVCDLDDELFNGLQSK